MPNPPDSTNLFKRRGGRYYGDERGEEGKKFGGTGGKDRIQIADTKLKLSIKN